MACIQDHPYRNICSVRQDATTSLIELQFDMLSAAESGSNDAVPSGLPFCTLRAQMRELEVVFLSRFVFELLRYINLLLKLRPAALPGAGQAAGEGASAEPSQVAHACRAAHTWMLPTVLGMSCCLELGCHWHVVLGRLCLTNKHALKVLVHALVLVQKHVM